jgi:hypothetical protein
MLGPSALAEDGVVVLWLRHMKVPRFVRPLAGAERDTLGKGLRSPNAFTLRRARIILASGRGERAGRIARQLGAASKASATPSPRSTAPGRVR